MTNRISVRVTSVTPRLAKQWLEANMENQRSLNARLVERYQRLMETNEWLIAEPIMFDTRGHLIDGQHRLTALVKSGLTIDMLIMSNCEPTIAKVVNTGRTRSGTDVLGIMGLGASTYQTLKLSLARAALRHAAGELGTITHRTSRGFQVENFQLVNWVQRNEEMINEFAPEVAKVVRALQCPLNHTAVFFSYYLFRQVDEAACKDFFAEILSGVRAGKADPFNALATRINDKGAGALRFEQQLALLIHTWNDWRTETARRVYTVRHYGVGIPMPLPV